MEASEANELQEQHEKARESSLRPVSFTMSVFAVLVAVVTVLGHRAHTESVLQQARAVDQWNIYQAKKIRQYNTQLTIDIISTLHVRDSDAEQKLLDTYSAHLAKWSGELKEEAAKATELEREVHKSERHAARFDLAEALLEIALVITSITLLTRQRGYWYLGMGFGVAGVSIAAWVFFIH
jgi:Domain of unknown function (DUF4337)